MLVVGCESSTDLPNGYIETTEEGSSTFVMKGYSNPSAGFNVLQPEGFEKAFYIRDKCFVGSGYSFQACGKGELDDISSTRLFAGERQWDEKGFIMNDNLYRVRYASDGEFRYMKLRVAYIEGNEVGLEYLVMPGSEKRPNVNANVADGRTSVTAYEMPALNPSNTYVDHYVTMADGSQVLNLAIEWNAEKKHSQWVAYAFNNITAWDKNIGRTDAWGVDLLLPEDMRIDNSYHTNDGFDRGHLCASEDRQYSKEANEQTFLFSNMSPQLNAFNGGFWLQLEKQVRAWAYAVGPNGHKNVYVVKGGTLNELAANLKGADGVSTTAEGYTVKGLACPKYYYMAVMTESQQGKYKGIAFLVPHDGSLPSRPTTEELKKYVVSIDQLEVKTGIDFFCNLPDDVEDPMENFPNIETWAWF